MKLPISVKLGVLFGIINCLVWFASAKYIGFYEIQVYVIKNISTLSFLALGIFITNFILKRQNDGLMEFKEALKNGMLYSLLIATVLAVFNYIYYTFITPDTIDFFVSEAKKYHEAHNVSGEDLQKYMDAERATFQSFRVVPPVLFYGLILSLLAGVVFQKKKAN